MNKTKQEQSKKYKSRLTEESLEDSEQTWKDLEDSFLWIDKTSKKSSNKKK